MNEVKSGPLVLVDEESGLRHYLAGEPVHAGDTLELQLGRSELGPGLYGASGWLLGRYEWTFEPGRRPLLIVTLPAWEDRADQEHAHTHALTHIPLPPQAILRRPR